MYDIEKKIKDNLAFFEDREPEDGHRDRFIAKLSKGSVKKSLRFYIYSTMKIAAVFLVLLVSSYYVVKIATSSGEREDILITKIEYSEDFTQIQNYYDELSNLRMLKIDEYAQNDTEAMRLKEEVINKMERLDANLAMIEKEYVKNPQSEALKEAIISNKKMKVEVVNNVVEQMNYAQRGYHAGSMYTNY